MAVSEHPRTRNRPRNRPRDVARAAVKTAWDTDSVGSAEHYRRREEEFDETAQTQTIYRKNTESLRDWIGDPWRQYCAYLGKEPIKTLRDVPIKVLDNFFHWLLHTRRDSLRSASTLQTY